MNCQQVDKYILDYCDNNLSPELTAELEQHFLNCSVCTKGLELTRLEESFLYNLPPIEPGADFTAKVMQNINAVNLTTVNQPLYKFRLSRQQLLLLPVAAVFILFLTTSFPSMFNPDKFTGISQVEDAGPPVSLESEPVRISLNDGNDNYVSEPIKQKEVINSNNSAPVSGGGSIDESKDQSGNLTGSDNEADNAIKSYAANPEVPETVIYDRELMKQDNPNRAEQHFRMASIDSAGINLSPQNIPAEFSLLEVQNNGADVITYCYIDEPNQITLDITIAKTEPESEETTINEEESGQELTLFNLPELETSGFNETLLNHLSWELNTDNELYIVTIKSNLPQEDIITLSSSITLSN